MIIKMRPRVKRAWIRALLSKKYPQGRNALRSEGEYCCMGVLCDLYRKSTGKGRWIKKVGSGDAFKIGTHSRTGTLPTVVSNWAGLRGDCDPKLTDKGRPWTQTASGLNDDRRYSFEKIAALIEKNL